ncbi:MAG: class I SAM-dependent methyltransferase [Defluviitaleaceae bacterium]|nr:class I SAM-dependent methyltransferase [Defluviitaleaceae bacterium]
MEISKRLLAIIKMIKHDHLIDIGCDHAYIPIYTIKNGIVKNAIAGDLNPGPLEMAKKNAIAYNLADKIDFRLGSGLSIVKDSERAGFCAVIAGMGGFLINKILEAARESLHEYSQIILQPQSDLYDVRKKVHELVLKIVDEEMVFEAGKYYNILSIEHGEDCAYQERDYILGKINIERKNDVFLEYAKGELAKLKKILSNLDKNEHLEKIKELEKLVEIYKGVLGDKA